MPSDAPLFWYQNIFTCCLVVFCFVKYCQSGINLKNKYDKCLFCQIYSFLHSFFVKLIAYAMDRSYADAYTADRLQLGGAAASLIKSGFSDRNGCRSLPAQRWGMY